MRGWVFGIFALLVGCSRTAKPNENDAPVVDAAPAPAPTRPARDAGAPLGDGGEHAYEGKLGANSRIAMSLTRTGDDILGSYTYVAVGTPIALVGKIDASGAMVLTEGNAAKPTGALKLARADGGDDLTGEWSDTAGKKTFPLVLKHMRSRLKGAPSLNRQGEQCLEDLACPAAEAERLFIESDDTHEIDAPCQRFLDGSGVTADLPRARACLERIITPCEGGSAFTSRALLATMRIDGVGGPADIAGGRALFANCYDDITKDAVLAHAAAKERDPRSPALDFCLKAGTTLTWEECVGWQLASQATRGLLAGKAIAASLDGEGQRLFQIATKAYEAYATSRAVYVLKVYEGGSVRIALATKEERETLKRRADDLAAFSSWKAKAASEDDATRAAKKADAALAAAGRSTELTATDTRWKTYRDAELAFYDHVFGAAQGHDEVRRALTVTLATRRAAECAAPDL